MYPSPVLESYTLVLFDVDNTLLDFDQSEEEGITLLWKHRFSEVISYQPFKEQYHEINTQIWNEVETGTLLPKEVKEVRAKRVLSHFELPIEDWESGANIFLQGLASVAAWLPGAEDAFHRIRQSHKVGLITNGLVAVQYPRIEKINIRRHLGTYQISQEVGYTKPDPRIFDLALKETGISKEKTLYIGDSLSSDYQGALNAGIDFCWYNPKKLVLPSGYPSPKFSINSWLDF